MTAKLLRNALVPLLLVATTSALTGCESSSKRQHARMDVSKASAGQHFDQMVTNAALHDRSVADLHFISHSSELSGTGELRLNRLAAILNTYGGTLRYETVMADAAMIEKRVANVREYLSLVGCNMAAVDIAVMRSGGHGMSATEAMAKTERGTSPDQQGGGGGNTSLIPGPMNQDQ